MVNLARKSRGPVTTARNVLALASRGPEALISIARMGLASSHDGGVSWTRLPSPPGGDVEALAAGADGSIAAVTGGRALFHSRDRGGTWQARGGPGTEIGRVAVLPGDALIVATRGEGLYRSSGKGAPWERILPGASFGLDLALPERGTWMVATDEGISFSTDGGEHWKTREFGGGVRKVTRDGAGRIFAAAGNGLFMSRDGGETWATLDLGLVIFLTYMLVVVLVGGVMTLQGLDGFTVFHVVLLWIMAGLAALFLLIAALVFGGRQKLEYTLDVTGVTMEQIGSTARRSHLARWLALLVGLLARRPGLVGTGLLARSSLRMDWDEVVSIGGSVAHRTVVLRPSLGPALRIHCPDEATFEAVLSRVAPHRERLLRTRPAPFRGNRILVAILGLLYLLVMFLT